jgi:hypothetical protein
MSWPDSYLWTTLVETAVAVVVLGWCLLRVRAGAWAVVASLGAAAYSVAVGVWAVVVLRIDAGGHPRLAVWAVEHDDALTWTRIAGVGVLLLAVTVVRGGGRRAGATVSQS